jgi:hypothetical protein
MPSELKQFERALLKRGLMMFAAQIVAMALAIYGAGGYLAYQNSLLIGRIDKRFDQMDKRFDQMEKRYEQMEKRFEDLKQVVLSDRERRKGKK